MKKILQGLGQNPPYKDQDLKNAIGEGLSRGLPEDRNSHRGDKAGDGVMQLVELLQSEQARKHLNKPIDGELYGDSNQNDAE